MQHKGVIFDIVIFIHTTNLLNISNSNSNKLCTKNAMDHAALIGNLELIEWLDKNRSEGCSNRALYNACKMVFTSG